MSLPSDLQGSTYRSHFEWNIKSLLTYLGFGSGTKNPVAVRSGIPICHTVGPSRGLLKGVELYYGTASPCSQFAMNLSRLVWPTLRTRSCLPKCTVAGTC